MKIDVAIIGGGMAGASLAAELAGDASVAIFEMEAQPGVHATGRSAAFWVESYGGPAVQPLTTASGPWLAAPPAAISSTGFLTPKGALYIAGSAEGAAALETLEASFAGRNPVLRRCGRDEIEALVPGVRPGLDTAVLEASCCDIDVAALHAAYLARARRGGVRIVCDSELVAAERSAGGWSLRTSAGTAVEAGILVNAAGAWADGVAAIAGVQPIGIRPYRRTIAQLRIDPPAPVTLPLVFDAAGGFYFKRDAGGRVWLSPHDETPQPAGDAAADALDVAIAIDRLEAVVDWKVVRVEHSWAGLRSFAPDRAPVYGYDPREPRFFWFAGQGGFGIQTAPAAAKLAAALLLRQAPEAMVAGIDASAYAPERFG